MALSVLELYVLSMLDRGCESPYDLRRDAGLSLGAISPALKRLLKQKLVSKVEEMSGTRRPRHQYALTRSGRQQARSGWKSLFSSGTVPADIDSVLRLADIGHYYKASPNQIARLLRDSGQERSRRAGQLRIAVAESSALVYSAMKQRLDAGSLAAEAKGLLNIAEEIEKQTGRRKQRRTNPRPNIRH